MPLFNIEWDKNAGEPQSFLRVWSERIADSLNQQLASSEPRLVAEVADVSRDKTIAQVMNFKGGPSTNETAESDDPARGSFDPPEPVLVVPGRFTDQLGVTIADQPGSRHIAAAVMFVGADHKADSDGGLAFAVRVASVLATGAGVVIVDILPGPANWATHFQSLTGAYPAKLRTRGNDATVMVMHPAVRGGAELVAIWHHAIASGSPLPTVPVPIRGVKHLKLDLEATYMDARQRSRISG